MAARTLWLLVKDEKDAKKGFAKILGFPAVDLVDPLLKIVAAGHDVSLPPLHPLRQIEQP